MTPLQNRQITTQDKKIKKKKETWCFATFRSVCVNCLSCLTLSTTSPSWMFPSLAARLSGEMSFTKMWLASRRPYSVFKGDGTKSYQQLSSTVCVCQQDYQAGLLFWCDFCISNIWTYEECFPVVFLWFVLFSRQKKSVEDTRTTWGLPSFLRDLTRVTLEGLGGADETCEWRSDRGEMLLSREALWSRFPLRSRSWRLPVPPLAPPWALWPARPLRCS